jgi:hypothetical protein
MNTETAYQNRDLSTENPLVPPQEISDSQSPNNKQLIPKDPKIKILIIMAALVFVLLIISILITTVKKVALKPSDNSVPTPVSTPAPNSPDDTGYSNMPDNYKAKFNVIDQKNQTDVDFNPPQITDDVGR